MSNYQPPRAETVVPETEAATHQPATSTRPNANPDMNASNDINAFGQQVQDPQIPTPAPSPAVEIKFQDANGQIIAFKMKSTTPFKKAMDAYASRNGIQRPVLRFLFDGERVQDDSTPTSLAMENGDTVEVHTEQIGGCAILD